MCLTGGGGEGRGGGGGGGIFLGFLKSKENSVYDKTSTILLVKPASQLLLTFVQPSE